MRKRRTTTKVEWHLRRLMRSTARNVAERALHQRDLLVNARKEAEHLRLAEIPNVYGFVHIRSLAPGGYDLNMSDQNSKRIMLRAAKDPFRVATPRETLIKNLIGTNTGNLIFSTAAAKILSTPHQSISVDVFNPGPEHADRINEQYDHYVIPLANAFRPNFIEHLDRISACIEQLTIPVTIFGVGAQAASESDQASIRALSSSVTRFCRAVLKRSPSIGVRGEFTANFLRSLGFSADEIQVIGCPSAFLTEGISQLPDRAPSINSSSSIAINLSPEVPGAKEMAEAHRKAYRNLTYIAQNLRDLRLFLDRNFEAPDEALALAPITPGNPLFNSRQSALLLDPYPWIKFMKRQDFSFGTRIHGNIAALLAGTPAVVVAHDTRTLELARYFEIPHVDMSGKQDISTLNAADLAANADYGPLKRGHEARRAVMTTFLDQHGLAHTSNRDAAAMAFDSRMNALALPGPVCAATHVQAFMRHAKRVIRRRVSR